MNGCPAMLRMNPASVRSARAHTGTDREGKRLRRQNMEHASTIPIGEKRVMTDTSFIRIVSTRTSEQFLTIEYFHPVTQKLVLKLTGGIYTADFVLDYADRDFWTITRHGRPLRPGEPVKGSRAFDADPRTRTLNRKD